jgi:predicted phosphoadenosine phosphosulfate sulfurtransferase
MQGKIQLYLTTWRRHGYSDGIPDVVPEELMQENLAPSYRAIALAILKNDHAMQSLGFSPDESKWYRELKRLEISQRPYKPYDQMRLYS